MEVTESLEMQQLSHADTGWRFKSLIDSNANGLIVPREPAMSAFDGSGDGGRQAQHERQPPYRKLFVHNYTHSKPGYPQNARMVARQAWLACRMELLQSRVVNHWKA